MINVCFQVFYEANLLKLESLALAIIKSDFKLTKTVVYFDQRLGAAHPKGWSKESFSAFFVVSDRK